MFYRPRFEIVEWWDDTGDVSVLFKDKISQNLCNKVGKELEEIIPKLEKHQNTTYHIEEIMNYIFTKMGHQKQIKFNQNNKWWSLISE
jgi:hypothetical protein